MLIAGPTASGKSKLALGLAQRLGATIINADSMQVYRDLQILTARPSPAEQRVAPHRLYGHVDAAENYSVGHWLRDVGEVLETVAQAGSLPLIVGGTGLYFLALTHGFAAIPPVPGPVRSALRARLAASGAEAMYQELQRTDPVTAARVHPGDSIRVLRALEVLEATGQQLSVWHRAAMPPLLDPRATTRVFLDVEPAELHRRIDARLEWMIASGALQEVRALAERRLNPLLPVMKAHGVPVLARALRGELTLDQALAVAKRDTRRYTKRQRTWFRHQLPDWQWLDPGQAEQAILEPRSRSRLDLRATGHL